MIKLISLFFLFIHPVYISTSEITINQNKALLKIKIFRDDLEDWLRMYHNKSISIDSQLKLVNESKYVDEYIMNKFILSINDDIINGHQIVTSGYSLYGGTTQLVMCNYDNVCIYNLDPIDNTWLFKHTSEQILVPVQIQ